MDLAYLISQYPAINHKYLLQEIRHLRAAGIGVRVASVRQPDRPSHQLSEAERLAAAGTFYIQGRGLAPIIAAHAGVLLRHPAGYLRGLFAAVRMASGPRSFLYHLFYFAEAVVAARWMEIHGLAHVHVSFALSLGTILTRILPVSMSFGVYGLGEYGDPKGARLAERVRAARFVRSNSRFGCNQIMLHCRREEWGKVNYLRLGIEPQEFPVADFREYPAPFEILTVGRLAPEKGQALLLAAAAQLVREGRNLRVRLVGGGPDRDFLEAQAASLGIASRVTFEGWVDEERLRACYAAADAFVLPSLYEGLPTVLVEAMCMEIACVAPAISGIPELIRPELEGLLYLSADIEGLAIAIARLMDDPALRRRMARAGRRRALCEYDIAGNTRRLAELFYSSGCLASSVTSTV